MADRQFDVSVILGAIDNASAALDKVGSSLTSMGIAAGVAFAAYELVKKGIVETVTAAAEHETAMYRVQKAVEASGNSWAASQGNVDDFLKSMMATSRFTDDELLSSFQRILMMTGNMRESMQGTKLAADMAASGLFDIDRAARLVGMAYEGNIQMLGRYIPQLKVANNAMLEAMTAHQRAEYAINLLSRKFGDTAKGELETYNGALGRMKTQYKELEETIGSWFLPTFKVVVKLLGDAFEAVNKLISANDGMSKSHKQIIEDFTRLRNAQTDNIAQISYAMAMYPQDSAAFKQLQQQKIAATEIWKTYNKGIKEEEKRLNAETAADAVKVTHASIEQIIKDHEAYLKWMETIDKTLEENERARLKVWEQEHLMIVELGKTISSSMGGALASMMKGTQNFSASFKNMGQAMADSALQTIATMTASWLTYHAMEMTGIIAEGQAKQMSAYAGIPFAGLALGLAGAAAIAAIISGFAGGVDNWYGGMALVGERGPELVSLPLGASVYSNSDSLGMLAGAGGSGTHFHAHISGGTFLGTGGINQVTDLVSKRLVQQLRQQRVIS